MKTHSVTEFIVCPECKKSEFKESKVKITCLGCRSVYPIKDGVLILITKKKQPHIKKIWNEKGEYNEYEFFTTPQVAKQVRKVTNEDSVVLDVGCGAGAYQNDFKGTVVAFDVIPHFVRKARKKFHKKNRFFIVADANEFPFKKSTFDLVFCSQVIEHFELKPSENLIKNMMKASKHYTMIDTPNDGNTFIHGLRDVVYGGPSVHEDQHLDHHRLVGRKDLEKFGFEAHSCIGYVSRHRFKVGPVWSIYDFVAWRIPDFGGNLIGIHNKRKAS